MKTKTSISHQWSGALSRPLLLFILSFTLALSGCEKAKDIVQPSVSELKATQTQDAKDEDYKRNRTGQYVSKDVQVPDYGGKERPTRPKYDIRDYSNEKMAILSDECPECYPQPPMDPIDPNYPCDGCNVNNPISSSFISSEGLGEFSSNPSGFIYALRVIYGDNSSIQPSEGHIKLNADLNKGAGGDYIYLTFTRDPAYSYENDGAHPPITYSTPLTHLMVEAHTQFGNINDGAPPLNTYRHLYEFDGTKSYHVDLNKGAGGRYIYGYVTREATRGNPIKEVGVLYGKSSTIQPPDASWIKVDRDLNEGAGGDYIYFCFKR